MTLVMTLLVRDEADIIEEHIAFHLAAGVDFFVATDHSSSDGTTDVLERYAARGVLHLLHESDASFHQSRWVTRMARLAATQFGAKWVINSDADEFWWPSGGNLKDVQELVPHQFGIVHTFVRPFLPRPGEEPFAERLIVRLAARAPVNDPSSSFRGGVRVTHRASPDVVVTTGNAGVSDGRMAPLRGWSPIEVLHFPLRSYEQFERKFLAHYSTVGGRRRDHVRAHRAGEVGKLRELYEEIYASEDQVRRGLAEGSLAIDTRIRDALRALAANPGVPLVFRPRTVSEDIGYALEGAAIDEAEFVRTSRQLDELEQRVASIEQASKSRRIGAGGARAQAVSRSL